VGWEKEREIREGVEGEERGRGRKVRKVGIRINAAEGHFTGRNGLIQRLINRLCSRRRVEISSGTWLGAS